MWYWIISSNRTSYGSVDCGDSVWMRFWYLKLWWPDNNYWHFRYNMCFCWFLSLLIWMFGEYTGIRNCWEILVYPSLQRGRPEENASPTRSRVSIKARFGLPRILNPQLEIKHFSSYINMNPEATWHTLNMLQLILGVAILRSSTYWDKYEGVHGSRWSKIRYFRLVWVHEVIVSYIYSSHEMYII